MLVRSDGRTEKWWPPRFQARRRRHGAGDSFAACLTYGLGEGRPPRTPSSWLPALRGGVYDGTGPYEGQLTSPA